MIDQMVLANIMLDIFAIVLSLIPVVYTLNDKRYRQRLNQYFSGRERLQHLHDRRGPGRLAPPGDRHARPGPHP